MSANDHIAIIAMNFEPEPSGNAPYTSALARGLVDEGFSVTASTTHPHYPSWQVAEGYGQWKSWETIGGASVLRLRHYVPSKPHGLRRLVSEISFGLRLFAGSPRGAALYIAPSPALFSTWIATFASSRRPLIVWVQDIYAVGLEEMRQGGRVAAWITRWVEGQTLRRARRVVVIHDRFKERLIGLYSLDPDRIVVMRNWSYMVAGDYPDSVSARKGREWGEETVVLYTGNFGVKQGLEVVIDAAKLAEEQGAPVRFILMGGGNQEQALRDYAISKGCCSASFSFLGPAPAKEFKENLAAADILLVCEKPGVSESSFPSKLATYFDAGKPIIAVGDKHGITAAELERSEAGILVRPGDPQALLDAALSLRAGTSVAASLGSAGRAYKETELSAPAALLKWTNLVKEVITESQLESSAN